MNNKFFKTCGCGASDDVELVTKSEHPYVYCFSCGEHTYSHDTSADAVKAWNDGERYHAELHS